MEREKENFGIGLSKSEMQALEMIRSRKYISIKLVIKNGKVDTIEGLERLDTKERIIDVLKQHDFQNIEIKQSHGKIVCVNRVFRQKISPN
ncbi:MAG: hypothetical protein AAFQ20_07045 [Bacteroidota bacterium]